jgi:hypothetical protein
LNRQHFDSHQLSLLIPYDTTTVSSFLLSDVCNDDGTGTQPVVGSRPSLKHMYDVSPTFVRLVQACHLHSNRSTEDVMPSCALLLYSMHLRSSAHGQWSIFCSCQNSSTERHTDYCTLFGEFYAKYLNARRRLVAAILDVGLGRPKVRELQHIHTTVQYLVLLLLLLFL